MHLKKTIARGTTMATTATKSKKIKTKYGTVIATPYEPPKPKAKPQKPLDAGDRVKKDSCSEAVLG
jgi:hypothetical protein